MAKLTWKWDSIRVTGSITKMETANDSSHFGRSRWRFSIRSLLVVTTIIALFASNIVGYMRLRETEDSLELLRNDIGELTINDQDLVHAIAIPSYETMTHRWRVFIPKGRKYEVSAAFGLIPEEGIPTTNVSIIQSELDARWHGTETILAVALNRDQHGRWQLICDDSRNNSIFPLPEGQTWLESSSGRTWQLTGDGETVVKAEGEPCILLRLRKAKQAGGGTTVDMEPTDGLLLWISDAT